MYRFTILNAQGHEVQPVAMITPAGHFAATLQTLIVGINNGNLGVVYPGEKPREAHDGELILAFKRELCRHDYFATNADVLEPLNKLNGRNADDARILDDAFAIIQALKIEGIASITIENTEPEEQEESDVSSDTDSVIIHESDGEESELEGDTLSSYQQAIKSAKRWAGLFDGHSSEERDDSESEALLRRTKRHCTGLGK